MKMLEKTDLEKNEQLAEGGEQTDLTPIQVDYLQQIEGLDRQTWEQLSESQRLAALNMMGAKLAEVTGAEPIMVAVTERDLPEGRLAVLEDDKILVNSSDLADPALGEKIAGAVLGESLGKERPVDFEFRGSDYEVVNAGAHEGSNRTISFTGSYRTCTPSSCNLWARDGEYVSCS